MDTPHIVEIVDDLATDVDGAVAPSLLAALPDSPHPATASINVSMQAVNIHRNLLSAHKGDASLNAALNLSVWGSEVPRKSELKSRQ